jgi:hypothetical protein
LVLTTYWISLVQPVHHPMPLTTRGAGAAVQVARAENLIRAGHGHFDHRNEIRCGYELSDPHIAGIHTK